MQHYLNPNRMLRSDDDTNIAYFCTKETALRRQGGWQVGAYQVWGFIGTTCLEFLLIIFSYATFPKKSQCSSDLSIVCLCACAHVYDYLQSFSVILPA